MLARESEYGHIQEGGTLLLANHPSCKTGAFLLMQEHSSKFDVEDAKRGLGMRTPSHQLSKQD